MGVFTPFRMIPARPRLQKESSTFCFMIEIRTRDWRTFCHRLNESEYGATVDIHWIDRATKTEKEIARAAEFEEITLQKRDGCSDRIKIRTSGESTAHHEIVEPIRILLRATEDGAAFNGLAVEGEEGTTIMTFTPVIRKSIIQSFAA